MAVPLSFTFYVFTFIFNKLDKILAPAITKLLIQAGLPLPVSYRLPGIGVIATILGVFLLGVFTTSLVGRKVVAFGETVLNKIPFIRGLYSSAKQFMEAVATPERNAFRKVVVMEFPRKGVYSIGFVTYEKASKLDSLDDDPLVNVFFPTAPNPTTGFFLVVPKSEIVSLPVTVDEGFKLLLSSGISGPREKLAGLIKKIIVDRDKVEVAKKTVMEKQFPPPL